MPFKLVARSGSGSAEDVDEHLKQIDAQLIRAPLLTEDEIIRLAHDADAVIVGAVERYTSKVIEALERCKIISRAGIGYDNIDVDAATRCGIPVAYVPDASTEEVSNQAMALLLAFSRKITATDRAAKAGGWRPGSQAIITIRSTIFRLSEQTLGLFGLGRIGSSVCRKAKAFGMRTIVYDPWVSSSALEALGAEQTDFDGLLTQADYISLHAPLAKETKHIFSLPQFQKMKPTAYLINTARGGLVDEEALVAALSEGYIAGAGLDVLDPEPPKPDNQLLKMGNVIITAHTAFYSQGSVRELGRRAAEAVVSALSGQWPACLANPEVKKSNNRRIK